MALGEVVIPKTKFKIDDIIRIKGAGGSSGMYIITRVLNGTIDQIPKYGMRGYIANVSESTPEPSEDFFRQTDIDSRYDLVGARMVVEGKEARTVWIEPKKNKFGVWIWIGIAIISWLVLKKKNTGD